MVRGIEKGKIKKPRITDYILDEIVTFVRRKKGAEPSNQVLETLTTSPKLEIQKIEKNHYEAAITIFKRYHRLSFTDAATVAAMKDIGEGELYSFDSGFDGIPGITRLTEI